MNNHVESRPGFLDARASPDGPSVGRPERVPGLPFECRRHACSLLSDGPLEYVDRVRKFLMRALCPQMGPLFLSLDPKYPPERISRSECWQMVRLELSLLEGPPRPVEDLHIVISDVITIMTRNEFPLTVPPRWLIDLFGILERAVALKMEKNRWHIRPSVPLDTAGQAFVEAILKNVDNDRRRSQRQHVSLSVGDQEVLKDTSGQVLLPPEEDPIIPKIPPTFLWGHRPHLWREIPRVDTPKRVRTDADPSEGDAEIPSRPPKRRVSAKSTSNTGLDAPSDLSLPDVVAPAQTQPPLQLIPASQVTPYGTSSRTTPMLRYSLSEIMNNPLRRYPTPMALYGTETDGALLAHPVFSINFGGVKDKDTFKRGGSDPAMCVQRAINAERVPGASVEFCSWNDNSTQPAIFCRFTDQKDIFHVSKLPQRRAAAGRLLHSWSYGIRLGDGASGA